MLPTLTFCKYDRGLRLIYTSSFPVYTIIISLQIMQNCLVAMKSIDFTNLGLI